MAAICLVCRQETWPLERHRIALITNPAERPTPRTWIWLCQACVRRWRAGEPLMELDAATSPLRTRAATSEGAEIITPRERQITALIAQGLSNGAIAERLVLTTGTVANHVAHIMRRLGLQTRTEIAVWAVRAGLVPTHTNGAGIRDSRPGWQPLTRLPGADGTRHEPDPRDHAGMVDGTRSQMTSGGAAAGSDT